MKNKFSDGRDGILRAPYACKSGDGALVGLLFGVACSDIAEGELGVFQFEGVYELPKDAQEVRPGVALYWDDATRLVTILEEGNTKIGAAMIAAAANDASALVRLNGTV